MALLSINEMTTYRWSFEEDVQHFAEAKIPGIGVWRHKLSDFGEERGVELLADSGLAVSSLLWAGGFTGSDGRSYKDSLDDARQAIRLAAAMKAKCLVVYSGSRAGHTHNHARRLLKGALERILPIACEFGVTLALEPMHQACAAGWTFLTELGDCLSLLDEVDGRHLKVVFDTYQFGLDEELLDRLPELASRIAVVQLADARQSPTGEQNRCRLGDGVIPLAEIVAALTRGGYDGFYDVKLMGEEIESSDYGELIAQSRQVFESLAGAAGVA